MTAGTTKIGSMKKVIKTKEGILVGAAGRSSSIQTVLDWWRDEEEKPPFVALETPEVNIIVVMPDGEVLHYEGDHKHPMQIKHEFFAIGSGSDVALGAMEMGASAQEAVKIAIKWDNGCSGKVQVVKL